MKCFPFNFSQKPLVNNGVVKNEKKFLYGSTVNVSPDSPNRGNKACPPPIPSWGPKVLPPIYGGPLCSEHLQLHMSPYNQVPWALLTIKGTILNSPPSRKKWSKWEKKRWAGRLSVNLVDWLQDYSDKMLFILQFNFSDEIHLWAQ